jgi:hypothetical protein
MDFSADVGIGLPVGALWPSVDVEFSAKESVVCHPFSLSFLFSGRANRGHLVARRSVCAKCASSAQVCEGRLYTSTVLLVVEFTNNLAPAAGLEPATNGLTVRLLADVKN